jgi:hypothetical protein
MSIVVREPDIVLKYWWVHPVGPTQRRVLFETYAKRFTVMVQGNNNGEWVWWQYDGVYDRGRPTQVECQTEEEAMSVVSRFLVDDFG